MQSALPADRAIVRGSTNLHKNFDFEAASKTLNSIDALNRPGFAGG